MKTTATLFKIILPLLGSRKANIALAPLLLFGFVGEVWAQGTAFYYQGRLNDGTNAANGTYDCASRFTTPTIVPAISSPVR